MLPSLDEQHATFAAASVAASNWFPEILRIWNSVGFAHDAEFAATAESESQEWFQKRFSHFHGTKPEMWNITSHLLDDLHSSITFHGAVIRSVAEKLLQVASSPVQFSPLQRMHGSAHLAALAAGEEFFELVGNDRDLSIPSNQWRAHSAISNFVSLYDVPGNSEFVGELISQERAAIETAVYFREFGPMNPKIFRALFDTCGESSDDRTIKKLCGNGLRKEEGSKRWFIRISTLDRLLPHWSTALQSLPMDAKSRAAVSLAFERSELNNKLHEVAK